VKTLCEKLIKIDILLTHVKLNKLSIVTLPFKQKKLSTNTKRQNQRESGKPKTGLFKNRPSVGFGSIENRSVSVSDSRRALIISTLNSLHQSFI
jgi:hypothetical protein